MKRSFAFVAAMLCLAVTSCTFSRNTSSDFGLKPRIVVLTDIAPGDIEPDDMESMIRLMAHADLFEIEALITSGGWNSSGRASNSLKKKRIISARASISYPTPHAGKSQSRFVLCWMC